MAYTRPYKGIFMSTAALAAIERKNLLVRALEELKKLVFSDEDAAPIQARQNEIRRDIGIQEIGGQIMAALDLHNMAQDDYLNWHFIQDLYIGDNQQIYCISVSNGRLYKWSVSVDVQNNVTLGEPYLVKPYFESADSTVQQTNRTLIRQREDGRYEGFAVLGTSALNKDGEIDARSLFDSFIERFKGDGSEYVNIYHMGHAGSRVGEIRAVFREDHLFVGYYILDDTLLGKRVGQTLSADTAGEWGGSLEFISDDDGQDVEVAPDIFARVYTIGTLMGWSIAHTAHGAAWGTTHIGVRMTKDQTNMQQANKDIVLKLLGGDQEALAMLEEQLSHVGERTAGAITRTTDDVEPDAAVEITPATVAANLPETLELALTDEQYNGLVQQVVETIRASEWFQPLLGLQTQLETISQTLTGLTAQFNGMQEASTATTQRITQVEGVLSEVEKHYRSLQPVSSPRIFTVRPGQSKQTATPAAQSVAQTNTQPASNGKPSEVRWKRTGLFEQGKKSK